MGVTEVVRQLCIMQHVPNWRESKYWEYTLQVTQNCLKDALIGRSDWDPNCYQSYLGGTFSSKERPLIDGCVADREEANTLLASALDQAMESRSVAVQLNGILVPFSLNQRTIGEEICSTFQPKPAICAEGYQEQLYREIVSQLSGRLGWTT